MGQRGSGALKAMGKPLPPGLAPQTLRLDQELARRAIDEGIDTVGTQAARLRLIERALGG